MEELDTAVCGTHEGARYWCNKRDNPGAVMSSILWVLTLYSDVVIVYIAAEGGWGIYNVRTASDPQNSAFRRRGRTDRGPSGARRLGGAEPLCVQRARKL